MRLSYYYKDPDAVLSALQDAGVPREDWRTVLASQPFNEDLYIDFCTVSKCLHIQGSGLYMPIRSIVSYLEKLGFDVSATQESWDALDKATLDSLAKLG